MSEVVIREADARDVEGIVRLAVRALGWAGDERDHAYFAWKHEQNPFGRSPAWVAIDPEDGGVLGFRTLMQWQFVRDNRRLRMVRAVDTASDPDHQGKGIFRSLTLHAVDELARQGFDAVFNTPNDQSRPGYLRMGWTALGRPTLGTRPAGVKSAIRMVGSRQTAQKWSLPSAFGVPAADALEDPAVEALLPRLPVSGQWSTPRTAAFLRWRYGFEQLNYRAIEVRDGLAIFRIRSRGQLREVALCEWLSSRPDRGALARLAKEGDYVVAVGLDYRYGLLPVPKLGPIVTWRTLATDETPGLGDIAFRLGDLELF